MRVSSRGVRLAFYLALILTLVGCEPTEGDPKAQCETHVEKGSPYFRDEGPHGFIIGRVWSTCDREPTSHVVEVHLQRKVMGVWSNQQMVFAGGGFAVCAEIPGRRSVKCERKHEGCTSGMWRVWFSVTYAADGGKLGPQSGTFVPNDGELPVREIKCPGPPGAQGGEASDDTVTSV